MKIKILSILLLFSVSVYAQESGLGSNCSLNSTLSKGTIVIGDQVQYTISVVAPSSYKVTFPAYSDSLMKGVEIVRKPSVDQTTRKDGKKEYSMKLLVTSFDSGRYELPAATIAISDNGKTDSVKTSTLWLTVNTVARDTTIKEGIYDIKAPIKEPVTIAEVAPWVFGGLLVAALVFLLVIYLKRRKQNRPFSFIQKPVDPPHVIALRELERINEEKLWASENHKYYYTRLIDVLRVYIEGRYEVSAMEQTTDEILGGLRQSNFPVDELYTDLQETLSLADLVKFAKYTPMVSDNERSLKFAFGFVEKTMQEVTSTVESTTNQEVLAIPQEEQKEIVQEQDKNYLS